ncbi:MAG TPA: VCBS repeat-containing protein, partial [Ignavibacteria bacterium]|nr:VCBS repeat-containing protein [Ignavibacteria bacterium]
MIRYCFLIVFVLFSTFSQNLHLRFDGIPVTINSQTSNSPFTGGIDIPRYQFIDIDNDNDLDLFIYDKDTNLNYYRNDGSAASANFRLISNKYFGLSIKSWFYFTNIDNDGDKDLFCGGDSQHVRYIKNNGTASNPVYQIQTFVLRTDLNDPILSEAQCVPVFVDIDADNDMDFITGTSQGRLTYYENIGNANNFNFKFISNFWKNLEIIGGALDHGASSITFDDIDGDNDRDLFWGDLFNPSFYYIRNTGTAQNSNYSTIDTSYPIPNKWLSGGFNMPRIHDIDNDGRKDLFIGVLFGSSTRNNFVYFRNTGTINNPQFTKITENYFTNIDAGSYSYPCFTDIDNDNDFDLFIGSDRAFLSFYRNTGTAAAPQFTLVTDSLFYIDSNNFNYSPAIADLDNDSKKDMILGTFDGKLKYYRNTGTLANPVFTLTASQLNLVDVGQSSAPALADLDNDGDFDLLIGNSDGKLHYYSNNGNASAFNFVFVTNNYSGIFVGNDSSPTLSDLDGDADLDMLVGNRLGLIYFYRNNGNAGNPNFGLISGNYANVNAFYASAPAIVDINGDSDKDLFVGNIKGG